MKQTKVLLKFIDSGELVELVTAVPGHVKEFDKIIHFNEMCIVYSLERTENEAA